jgi:hypothetical protein
VSQQNDQDLRFAICVPQHIADGADPAGLVARFNEGLELMRAGGAAGGRILRRGVADDRAVRRPGADRAGGAAGLRARPRGLRQVADAGAGLILLNPLDDEGEQMERLAAEVMTRLP